MPQKTQPNRLLDSGQAVLVVIDMQEKLLPAITDQAQVLENNWRLVRVANILGLPIVTTEQQKLGPTVQILQDAMPGVAAVPKVHFNCFGATEFAARIRALGRTTLVLTGVEAHICVAQTALHALADFQVQVVSDATSSRARPNWQVAMERLRDNGVTVTSTEMVIYELLGQAGTETFREVLPLVK